MSKRNAEAADNIIHELLPSNLGLAEFRSIARVVNLTKLKNGFIKGKCLSNKGGGLIDFDSYSFTQQQQFSIGPITLKQTKSDTIRVNDIIFGVVTVQVKHSNIFRYFFSCTTATHLQLLISSCMSLHAYRKQTSCLKVNNENEKYLLACAAVNSDYRFLLRIVKSKSLEQQQSMHDFILHLSLFCRSPRLYFQYYNVLKANKLHHNKNNHISYKSMKTFNLKIEKQMHEEKDLLQLKLIEFI